MTIRPKRRKTERKVYCPFTRYPCMKESCGLWIKEYDQCSYVVHHRDVAWNLEEIAKTLRAEPEGPK